MRIVYIHQYFRTPSMSGGTRSYEFARRLVEHGHTVDMVTTCPAGRGGDAPRPGSWTVTREAGLTVHWCAVDYSNHLSHPARVRAFVEFAVRAIFRVRSLPRDVVFATSTPLTVAIPAIAGCLRGVPMVFEVRDLWPDGPIVLGVLRNSVVKRAAYALEACAYRRSSQVVALSPEMAASINRRFPEVPVSVIPNSADVELFSVDDEHGRAFRAQRPWLGDGPLIVYAGTFGRVNNLSYVVRVAQVMRTLAPEVRFLLVGDGKEEIALKESAEQAGVLGQTLFFEPSAPKQDMPALLAAADMCLSTVVDIPELAGSSANKAFDAFAAGRPLVINHDGSLADILRASGAGLVVPPSDPASAARTIAEHLDDGAWMSRAAEASHGLALHRFDRDILFAEFERVVTSAARTSSGCGR